MEGTDTGLSVAKPPVLTSQYLAQSAGSSDLSLAWPDSTVLPPMHLPSLTDVSGVHVVGGGGGGGATSA